MVVGPRLRPPLLFLAVGALFIGSALILTSSAGGLPLAYRLRQRSLGATRGSSTGGTELALARLVAPGTLEAAAPSGLSVSISPPVASCFPILMFCNNRPNLLEQTLRSLFAVRHVKPERVVASQDGPNPSVRAVLDLFKLSHFEHPKVLLDEKGKRKEGAMLIAEHYRWAIEKAFAHFGPTATHLIIVEDDMLFAPDFAEYFIKLAPLLEHDPTLWTVSAFNDNGYSGRVLDDERVLRTDWTVGFGWLLRRRLWEDELRDGWPKTHWDHWMRSDKRRKGRETLFPEVSRNYHTGAKGTHSQPGLFERYFQKIRLSKRPNPVLMGGDVGALTQPRYEAWLAGLLAASEPVGSLAQLESIAHPESDTLAKPALRPLALCYASAGAKDKAWEHVATYFGFWHTLPVRGDHNGLLLTGFKGRYLLLVASWSPYTAKLPAGTQPIGSTQFVQHGALAKLAGDWMAKVAPLLPADANGGKGRRASASMTVPLGIRVPQ